MELFLKYAKGENYDLCIKKLIDSAFDMCETLERTNLRYSNLLDSEMPTKNEFQISLCNFLIYLSGADNNIDAYEAQFINEYLEMPFITVNSMKEFNSKFDIRNSDFKNEIPNFIIYAVYIDNYIFEQDGNSEFNPFCLLVMNLFELLGKELISCDDEITEREVEDLSSYVYNLRNYIKEELKCPFNTSLYDSEIEKIKQE